MLYHLSVICAVSYGANSLTLPRAVIRIFIKINQAPFTTARDHSQPTTARTRQRFARCELRAIRARLQTKLQTGLYSYFVYKNKSIDIIALIVYRAKNRKTTQLFLIIFRYKKAPPVYTSRALILRFVVCKVPFTN